MKREDLKRGLYYLTKPVTNPKPDRRKNQQNVTDWPDWVTIPEGFLLRVEFEPYFRISSQSSNYYGTHGKVCEYEERYKALLDLLVDALAPVESLSLSGFLWAQGGQERDASFSILQSLIRHGILSWPQLQSGLVLHKYDTRSERTEDDPPPVTCPAPLLVPVCRLCESPILGAPVDKHFCTDFCSKRQRDLDSDT